MFTVCVGGPRKVTDLTPPPAPPANKKSHKQRQSRETITKFLSNHIFRFRFESFCATQLAGLSMWNVPWRAFVSFSSEAASSTGFQVCGLPLRSREAALGWAGNFQDRNPLKGHIYSICHIFINICYISTNICHISHHVAWTRYKYRYEYILKYTGREAVVGPANNFRDRWNDGWHIYIRPSVELTNFNSSTYLSICCHDQPITNVSNSVEHWIYLSICWIWTIFNQLLTASSLQHLLRTWAA